MAGPYLSALNVLHQADSRRREGAGAAASGEADASGEDPMLRALTGSSTEKAPISGAAAAQALMLVSVTTTSKVSLA